jgi:hypothetical protein
VSTAFALSLYRSSLWIFNRLCKLLVGRVAIRASVSTSVNLIKLVDYCRISDSSLALVSSKAGLGSLSKDLSWNRGVKT